MGITLSLFRHKQYLGEAQQKIEQGPRERRISSEWRVYAAFKAMVMFRYVCIFAYTYINDKHI